MKIGPYEVLGTLGRGGMGVVTLVRTPEGKEAALKLLKKADPETLARFEREKRLLASLGEEQGFVGFLDAGTAPEGAWLLMPFVPGGTLRRRLDAGPLGVAETVALGTQLAQALGAAHARGIVHRDVKPENVLFTREGRPLIADLGLGKHFDRDTPGASQSVELSRSGVLKGTVGYMAPEQVEDAGRAGPAADVYALGAVLYECLAGRPAFLGENALEVLSKVTSGILEPIGRPEVPPWLEGVVLRALARDPARRFAHGGGLAGALRGVPEPKAGSEARSRSPRLLPVVACLGLGAALASIVAWARTVPGPAAMELVKLAQERARASDWEGAIAHCTKAIELAPKLAPAWRERGQARLWRRELDVAIADETRAIELDPGVAGAWEFRGRARGMKGDFDGAMADLTRAIELDPGNAPAWQQRGAARGFKGDVDGWIADETRAIELDSSLVDAWQQRGVARGLKGDFEGEAVDETRATTLAPTWAPAWASLASARYAVKDWDGVIADATRAIELDPKLAEAWQRRGTVRDFKGDWDGAIADETRAIELDPNSAAAWTERGLVRGRKRDTDGAIADFTRAIELDPRNVAAWLNRGRVWSAKNEWDRVIADETKAIELDPRIADAWSERGLGRAKKGEWDEAIADTTKALELDPELVSSLKTRGAGRDLKGDAAGAIADFERFLELAPGDAQAPDARRRIAELRAVRPR